MYITIELESREGRIMYMPSCSNCIISLHVCTQAIESNSNFTIRLGFLSAGIERFYTTSALLVLSFLWYLTDVFQLSSFRHSWMNTDFSAIHLSCCNIAARHGTGGKLTNVPKM